MLASDRDYHGRAFGVLGRRDYGLALALVLASAAVLLPGLFFGLPGKSVAGAVRILGGEVPYRDFWTMYAPGMFYATAGVFRVFGLELLAQGAVSLLFDALVVGTAFLLFRRLAEGRRAASVLALAFLGAFWRTGREITGYSPALLLLLLCWHALLGYWEHGGQRRLLCAGLCAGLAACFKHDVAAYVFLGATASLFAAWLLAAGRRPPRWEHPLAATLLLGAGAAATFLPPAAWIAWRAGADAWQDLFVFPAVTFAKVMVPSYPPLLPPLGSLASLLQEFSLPGARGFLEALSDWLLCQVPQYALVVALVVAIRLRRTLAPATLAVILMEIAALPGFWWAAHIQRNTHLASMALISLSLAALAWARTGGAGGRARWPRGGLLAGCALVAAGLWLEAAMTMVEMRAQWREGQVLDVPGARHLCVPARVHAAYPPILAFLRANTGEDERIYVGLARHDAIVINDWSLHVLARRRSCTRYSELHRGVADVAAAQREIISDIERHGVRAVVLWEFGWPDSVLDHRLALHRAKLPELGSTLLDEYIAEHFELVARYGEYRLMWRKESPRPERW
jgi:hypothetical protein